MEEIRSKGKEVRSNRAEGGKNEGKKEGTPPGRKEGIHERQGTGRGGGHPLVETKKGLKLRV